MGLNYHFTASNAVDNKVHVVKKADRQSSADVDFNSDAGQHNFYSSQSRQKRISKMLEHLKDHRWQTIEDVADGLDVQVRTVEQYLRDVHLKIPHRN